MKFIRSCHETTKFLALISESLKKKKKKNHASIIWKLAQVDFYGLKNSKVLGKFHHEVLKILLLYPETHLLNFEMGC